MKNKTFAVRLVCVLLALLMVGGLATSAFFAAYADDNETPAQKLVRIQNELKKINEEIEANKADVSKAAEVKKAYEEKLNLLQEQIDVLQANIEQTQTSLDELQTQLGLKAEEVLNTQEKFEQRLDAMYRRGAAGQLETLLGCDSFADMLRAAHDLQDISESDINLIGDLRKQKEELESQRATVEEALSTLDSQKAELDSTRAEYQSAIQQANADISNAQAEQQANEAAYADKEEEYKQAEAAWQAWASAQSGSNTPTEYTGGIYIWPVPGYYNISSGFSVTRTIYGVVNVHRGIDIPAPAGTPIYAAASGYVSTNNHWTYGISVKVTVTTSTTNIYGHMSARASGITDGVWVEAGQLIGYVGSTGNSTGNHLHFEVDIGGSPVSPWPYFGQ